MQTHFGAHAIMKSRIAQSRNAATLTNEFATRLARALLLRVNGLGSELKFIKRFPDNPWKRIAAEVDQAVQPLRDLAANCPSKKEKRPCQSTAKDIENFLQIIQRKKHNEEELKAFFAAWKGAIENVQSGAFTNVLTYDKIIDIYEWLVHTPDS